MKRFYILILLTSILALAIKLVFPKPIKNKEETAAFWSNKTNTNEKFDVIACGDSRVYRGISNDVLPMTDKELSFLNLGYSSAGLSDEYLDFVTAKFGPASNHNTLIVGITPHSFTASAKQNQALHSYQEVSGFDLFRHRYLSPVLKHLAPYKPMDVLKNKASYYLEEFHDDGWVASDKAIPDSTIALPSYRRTFSKHQVTKAHMDDSAQKLHEIANDGVRVIAFRMPTTERMRALEDSLSGFDESYLKSQLQHPSITWLDFDDNDFASYDGSHLRAAAARKLSIAVGKAIAESATRKHD